MRVMLLTQDEPFFLAEHIEYLIRNIPKHSQIVACVLFDASPFGKKEGKLKKLKKTLSIFGFHFTWRYIWLYVRNKARRRPGVHAVLQKYDIPIVTMKQNVNSEESLALLSGFKPDLLLSIAGNQIFKKKLIELAPKGCLNLHTALLPKYRGLMPSFWVLKNNELYMGVSVFFVDEGIDNGPILVQKKTEIGSRSLEELIQHTKKMGIEAIIEAVDLVEKGNFKLIANDHKESSYYHFPTKEDRKEFLRAGKRFF